MTSAIWADFGYQVRNARSRKGWTLEQLAQLALANPDRKGYVSQIENGKRRLSPRTIGNLARVLDLPETVTRSLLLQPEVSDDAVSDEDRGAERLLNLTKRDETAPPAAEALLVSLAYEFAHGSHAEIITAYTGLRSALQAAANMKARGDLPQNADGQLQAVMRRVSALNDEGRRDEAGSEIEEAIKRNDAAAEALFNLALGQDRVRNAPEAAARRLIARLKSQAPPGGVFNATRDLVGEWGERGQRQGNPFDLKVALALAVMNHDRARGPAVASALNDLGVCHHRLGERQTDSSHLKRSATAFSAALKVTRRNSDPVNWAGTQNNLGNALRSIGNRERDSARLLAAVKAYEAALTVQTRKDDPVGWAGTQANLGNALQSLGDREQDSARLLAAVRAYEAALTVLMREDDPVGWAGTQANLGNALRSLGDREQDGARLFAAVKACEAALTVHTREDDPVGWAATQNNLGLGLGSIGVLSKDLSAMDRAEAAFRACLSEHTRATLPFGWARTHWNLGDLALARYGIAAETPLLTTAREHLTQARDVFAEGANDHQIAECDRLLARVTALGG